MDLVDARLGRLTKPPQSLGRLEELVVWLAGVTGIPDAAVAHPAIVVAAADHGVAGRGVSAYPSDVTAQMIANFEDGGAAINVLAAWAGATLTVIDVGVHRPTPSSRPGAREENSRVRAHVVRRVVMDGTADMTSGPAMTRQQAERAIDAGREVCAQLISGGTDLVGLGEIGIGNTTAASAITAALTNRPVALVTGRGTGLDQAGWERKVAVIETALRTNRPNPDHPLDVVAAVGGLEIAGLVGVILESAWRRVPVVLDGFITAAAALIACRLEPSIRQRLLAAHRSTEPGHAVVLEELHLRPVLELDLRLGEGTGAALVVGLLRAACRLRDEMSTFESAGVAGPLESGREASLESDRRGPAQSSR